MSYLNYKQLFRILKDILYPSRNGKAREKFYEEKTYSNPTKLKLSQILLDGIQKEECPNIMKYVLSFCNFSSYNRKSYPLCKLSPELSLVIPKDYMIDFYGANYRCVDEKKVKFRSLMPDNCFIAGGFPTKLMVEDKLAYYCDLDVFIVAKTQEEHNEIFEKLAKAIDETFSGELDIKRNKYVTTIYCSHVEIQVIHRLYETPNEILGYFDLSCCKVMFSREDMFFTPDFFISYLLRAYPISYKFSGSSYIKRIQKYSEMFRPVICEISSPKDIVLKEVNSKIIFSSEGFFKESYSKNSRDYCEMYDKFSNNPFPTEKNKDFFFLSCRSHKVMDIYKSECEISDSWKQNLLKVVEFWREPLAAWDKNVEKMGIFELSKHHEGYLQSFCKEAKEEILFGGMHQHKPSENGSLGKICHSPQEFYQSEEMKVIELPILDIHKEMMRDRLKVVSYWLTQNKLRTNNFRSWVYRRIVFYCGLKMKISKPKKNNFVKTFPLLGEIFEDF